MEASHKTHRPHIKVGKDAEEEEEKKKNFIDGYTLFTVGCCQFVLQDSMFSTGGHHLPHKGGGGQSVTYFGWNSIIKPSMSNIRLRFNVRRRTAQTIQH